ncbi:hypothetical protein Q3G72_002675 [Acer saccharum]|nr:hypothetical protein Q3G72_002675 [Acer saccharum]
MEGESSTDESDSESSAYQSRCSRLLIESEEYSQLSSMKWHSLLFDYGLPEDGKDFAADDADANLVPTLMEKVAP